jgi:hypothetical protein
VIQVQEQIHSEKVFGKGGDRPNGGSFSALIAKKTKNYHKFYGITIYRTDTLLTHNQTNLPLGCSSLLRISTANHSGRGL